MITIIIGCILYMFYYRYLPTKHRCFIISLERTSYLPGDPLKLLKIIKNLNHLGRYTYFIYLLPNYYEINLKG